MSRAQPTPRRTTGRAARITLTAFLAVLLLGGCNQILGEDLDGLTITVNNKTNVKLTLAIKGQPDDPVAPGKESVARMAWPRAECTDYLTATTIDGTLVADYPGEVCDGDTWVIAQSDLKPVQDATSTPSPSS